MPHYPGLHVIIIDDCQSRLKIVEKMVQDSLLFERDNISCFLKPAEAIEFMTENHADILITDYRMPEFDGNEVTTAAKEILPGIKIILYSDSGIVSFPNLKVSLQKRVNFLFEVMPTENELLEALKKVTQELGFQG